MNIPTIKAGGKEIPHNTVPWRVCTNRHTSTAGNCWGWIEGARDNVCWSNDDDTFNEKAAHKVVAEHNQWLEDQKPVALKIIETKEKLAEAYRTADDLRARLLPVERKINELTEALAKLENESK